MEDELAFQNLQNAIENMKRERDELLQEYQKEKTDFQAFDAQIRKMQMELDLRVAILKDKESKLANYNKMIEETDLTYHRIVETSNRLAANLEKETQFIRDRFKRQQQI
ncbi:unnamed protein product [Paramecium primaurelia]|uniref:Uncharacterized protein n=2 Tax=Paramecium TaxID=5884 RepID=A0A8S1VTQ2_9CILI|nr:unnamed protein product [Paramecium primaurelia]CAD8179159.1 unnamed protein product [Paramecium pentaurelia]